MTLWERRYYGMQRLPRVGANPLDKYDILVRKMLLKPAEDSIPGRSLQLAANGCTEWRGVCQGAAGGRHPVHEWLSLRSGAHAEEIQRVFCAWVCPGHCGISGLNGCGDRVWR